MVERRTVRWTRIALSQLEAIRTFWTIHADSNAAGHIVDMIKERSAKLANPFDAGLNLDMQGNRKHALHFVLYRHWKLIFQVRGKIVYIVSVWDTRRNPARLEYPASDQ